MNLHDTTPTPIEIYVITDEGHYGTDTFVIGEVPGVTIRFEEFSFDPRNWEPEEETVESDIEVLQGLKTKTGTTQLDEMIHERQEWLTRHREHMTEVVETERAIHEAAIENARRLLREAGEL